MLDPIEFGKAMAAIVREAQTPLLARIEALEKRQPERGERGEKGERGESGPQGDRGEPGVAGERGPQGEKGETGVSIKGDPGPQGERGEPGVSGEKGERGEKGEKGDSGRDADPIDIKDVCAELLTMPELKALVDLHTAESVQDYFKANPVQHGKDGRDGERGPPGESIKGEPGADGIGLAGAMIDRDGCLVVTTTKGVPMNLGRVVGKDGERGKDGADFSHCTIEYDGERSLIIRGNGGEIVKRMPIPIDKGYWREGLSVEKGDIVTHAGNAWIALRDNAVKPCHENKDDWRLFARGGRDGADGRNGRDLGPREPVKLK